MQQSLADIRLPSKQGIVVDRLQRPVGVCRWLTGRFSFVRARERRLRVCELFAWRRVAGLPGNEMRY
jgi:hypothetical protein